MTVYEVASEKALAMTKACHYKDHSMSLRGSFPKQPHNDKVVKLFLVADLLRYVFIG
ncbi:hypothetical protein [Candidatus Kuenenia sp.]|uniref:hypothetical protein n=1 Tax=Candidatus Kuenenia sp. TaxID=2499824 RepID=UPI0032208EE0